MKSLLTAFSILLSFNLYPQVNNGLIDFSTKEDTIYYDPSNPPQVFKGGVGYVENFSLPASLPKTNLLGYWSKDYGINADSTIYLVDANNNPVDTIDLVGLDWDITNDSLGIPLKTAAYMDWVGTPSIDTAFWNHNIYPTTVFQNVDYDSTTYFKLSNHRLNADSTELYPAKIEAIALYSGKTDAAAYFNVPALSGSEVWVNQHYAGGSNDGSYAKPYTTIEDAYKAVTGDTIFVKSGIYNEDYNGTTIRYLYLDKNQSISAIGNSTITSQSTSYEVRPINNTNYLSRFVIDGEGNSQYNVNPHTASNTLTYLNNCVFKGATTKSIYCAVNATVMDFVLNKCVSLNNLTADINTLDGAIISESYVHDVSYIDNKFYWNKVYNGTVRYNTGSNIAFNDFYAKKRMLSSNVATGDIIVKGNVFTWEYADISENHYIVYNDLQSSQVRPIITYNKFYALETDSFAYPTYFINLAYAKKPEINYNYFESRPKSMFAHINLTASDSVFGKCQINYNTSYNRSLRGTVFSLGGETTKEGKFDSTEVIGNKGVGHLLSYPGMSASTHFILCNAGINFDIRYNDIEYTYLGLVIKTGGEKSYTAGGLFYNVFKNNARAIWVRGVKDLTIAGTTIYKDIAYNPYNGGSAIYLDENSANAGDQYCKRVLVKNTLIYSIDETPILGMDLVAADSGCVVSNTVLYNATDDVLNISGTRYTVAEATTETVFSSVVKQNPLFTSATQLWPVTQFNGANLGAAYDDGLDISTTWGSSTTVPNIVTKQQGATWQIGAYVQ